MPELLPMELAGLRAGDRVGVAVSGGADSFALLLGLHDVAAEMGLVLRVVHFHHGLRGAEADADAAFVRDLAVQLDLPFDFGEGDTAARASEHGESIEEAARLLRYDFFRGLIAAGTVGVVVTAHTMDDQAETVVMKMLRGAWTEGLGGISPDVAVTGGRIVRPLLQTRRAQVECFLRERGQAWREDSSNASNEFTRNRVRREVMPLLRGFNPAVDLQMSRLAELARDEEAYWQQELARVLPGLLLDGKPVRGGGRSVESSIGERSVALDVVRLRHLSLAVQRRVLRAAAARLGVRSEFDSVAMLLAMVAGQAGQRQALAAGLLAERTARELRLSLSAGSPVKAEFAAVMCAASGSTAAPEFGLLVRVDGSPASSDGAEAGDVILRVWKAGDRVRLRHTLSPSKVKDVLQRLHASPQEKRSWPVVEWRGEIVWMRGVDVHVVTGAPAVVVTPLEAA